MLTCYTHTPTPIRRIELAMGVWFRGHRDHVINFSSSFVALGNALAVLLSALPSLMPPDWLPDWISGPYIIFLTSTMTAISSIVALMQPVSDLFSIGSKFAKTLTDALRYGGCLAMAKPLIALMSALRVSMWARFQVCECDAL